MQISSGRKLEESAKTEKLKYLKKLSNKLINDIIKLVAHIGLPYCNSKTILFILCN